MSAAGHPVPPLDAPEIDPRKVRPTRVFEVLDDDSFGWKFALVDVMVNFEQAAARPILLEIRTPCTRIPDDVFGEPVLGGVEHAGRG